VHRGVSLSEHRHGQAQVDLLLDALGSSVHTLDPATGLCASGVCVTSAGGHAFYIGANHLSQSGARLLEPTLEPLFHSRQGARCRGGLRRQDRLLVLLTF
jgi:hypothetical protein